MQYYLSKILGLNNENHMKPLDGIRAIAVLMVFMYHIWGLGGTPRLMVHNKDLTFFLSWGHPGVDLFYLLSGFLLFLPFAKSYYFNKPKPNLKQYFIRRSLRIIPAYYAFIALYIVFSNGSLISKEGLKTIFVNLLFLQNFFIDKIPTLNGTTWTLAIEVQFYILLPFVAPLFLGKRNKISLPLSVLLVLIYRLIIYKAMTPNISSIDWEYYKASEYNILGCFDNFAIGMTIANIYQCYKHTKNAIVSRFINFCRIAVWFAPILFVGLIYHYYHWRFSSNVTFSWYFFSFFFDSALYLTYAFFLLYVLFFESKLRQVLSNFYFRIIGIIGYSVYLWHITIINMLLKTNFINSVDGWNRYARLLPVSVLVVIPFSFVVFVLVEKYFIDISHTHRSSFLKNPTHLKQLPTHHL